MGCGGSTGKAAVAEEEPLEPLVIEEDTRRKFNVLNLDDHILTILWKTFCDIASINDDTPHHADSNQKCISKYQFHLFYKLDENRFTRMVFSRMDHGSSGHINFEDYVISIWDFLTSDLHHFVFHLYDTDNSKGLTINELEELWWTMNAK